MSELMNVDKTWQTMVVAIATEIVNDETAIVAAASTFETFNINGCDEVTISPKTFLLDSATSIDLYLQVADDNDEWRYVTVINGDVWKYALTGTTRKNRALPATTVRGQKLRCLVGSTGTPGNETISLDIMRHKKIDL